LMKITF